MPTPRALLLLICPLLLLSLAGPLAAAQPPPGLETEASRQAAAQEALRATVAEQARELDRLSGKVDGLQTSLDSAAKASEAASRTAQLVVGLLGVAVGLAAAFITLLAFLGYRRADQVARDLTADIEAVGDQAKRHLEDARQCEERVRANAERFDDLMKHIEQYRDALQAEALKYQNMVGMSDEEKQALAELAPRLDFLEAFGLPLDPESYLARGNAYFAKGDFERSLQCCDRALKLKPDLAEAHHNRGAALENLGELQDALAAFDQAIQHKPDYVLSHLGRAIVLAELKRYEDSLIASDRAIELAPDLAEAHDSRAAALLFLHRYEAALAASKRAIELKPDFATAHFNRACAYSRLDQRQEALADLKRAINLDSKCREKAKTDPDFEPLHSDLDFRKLVGLDPDPDQPAES